MGVAVATLVACGGGGGSRSSACRGGNPLAGVYLPSRLTLVQSCATVSGVVDCLKVEPDGDVHVRLRPDQQYADMLKPANAAQVCIDHPDPHLVVEIIPQHGRGLFPTNSAERGGFVTPQTPGAGDHIVVTGPYVLDKNRLHNLLYPGRNVSNWAEIHPAWRIVVDRQAPVPAPNQPGPDLDEGGD